MDATPPDWAHCGIGADENDPVGCRGRRIGELGSCLRHLDRGDRETYLAGLRAGAYIDVRGTEISSELLDALLEALCDPEDGNPHIGGARFHEVLFTGKANFHAVRFSMSAWFTRARFSGNAQFSSTVFSSIARFDGAEFGGSANFDDVRCGAEGREVAGRLVFSGAVFATGPWFMAARGVKELKLNRIRVAELTVAQWVAEHIDLSHARFDAPVTLKVSNASIDLTHAYLAERCTLTSMAHHVAQSGLPAFSATPDQRPSITSLSGVDASMLLLFDIDLSRCVFTGTYSLDQLQIEGSCTFAEPPRSLRWTRRRVIMEEVWWRRWQSRGSDPKPTALADTYRQLRKAREDAGDEPGAADFYYGEMEMRRHGKGWSSAERWLLQMYWLLSGYGLRASRALLWLTVALFTTVLLLMGYGLPDESPKQEVTRERVDGEWKTVIDKPDAKNPTGDRFTAKRFEKAVNVTLNSVVFRSSGQDLTLAGTYIEMASRFSEPVLLALAALAVRGRVKRGS